MKIAIIGLGYVGLPLATEFAKKHVTIGFDINFRRVEELKLANDSTLEVDNIDLKKIIVSELSKAEKLGRGLYCSTDINDLKTANFYIVTVPTPTDKHKIPDLNPLIKASTTVGNVLKKGDYVIYESTVYPGVTEDECVPVLEQISGLKLNTDFFVGYSPERINPGDKVKTLKNIKKVTSGSNPEAAKIIDDLYNEIIEAGTHLAPSIKVAEASKVVENSQRDINIAFINELSQIFNKIGLDTNSVLEAAGTKWNFLPFKPGLVGGHCIGVDPYYLAQKAQDSGYYPEIILAGRRINDSMGSFITAQIVKKMVKKNIPIRGAKALILGFTFKENCPDIRNTKVIDIYTELKEYGAIIDIYDPWVNPADIQASYNLDVISKKENLSKNYEAVILAVAHTMFLNLDLKEITLPNSLVYDIKGFLPINNVDGRL